MRKYILIAIITAVFSSCSSNQETNNSVELEKNTYGIELINNEKWVVNEEMMVHVKNMESTIKAASSKSNPDYKTLGSKLDEHISLLTSSCTMKGKAHDELHKWLLPFIDHVKELNKATTKEQQKAAFQDIQKSMNEFKTYFK